MNKKTVILILLPIILILGIILWIANSLFGNPVSKLIVKNSSQKYLIENFDNPDLYIDRVGYNFKNNSYFAHVVSKKSIDTRFAIYSDGFGRIKRDDYANQVMSGWNTAMRLEEAYRKLVNTVLEAEDFPYKSNIAFGELVIDSRSSYFQNINYLSMSDLELDKEYDIKEMGRKYGHLVIYVDSDEVSEEKAAEILIDIKNRFDKADVPFYSIDFTLEKPKDENNDGKRPGEPLNILYFLAEDIYEDGMVERVQEAHAKTDAYYKEMEESKLPK